MENLSENVQDEEPMSDTETVTDGQDETENSSNRELVKMISQDERVGHFIVDVLSGTDPQEAVGKYFTVETTPPNEETLPDVEALIAEAEQRGYVRGRNEKIELEMQRPSMWNGDVPEEGGAPQPPILNNMRQSVWER